MQLLGYTIKQDRLQFTLTKDGDTIGYFTTFDKLLRRLYTLESTITGRTTILSYYKNLAEINKKIDAQAKELEELWKNSLN